MNFNRGLLCGLTDEFADFDNRCENFEEDKASVMTHTTNQVFFEDEPASAQIISGKLAGLLILLIIVISFVIPSILEQSTESFKIHDAYHYFRFYALTFSTWLFIGLALKKLNFAMIAGGVHLVLFTALIYSSPSNYLLREIAPILCSSACFSLLVFTDKKNAIKFTLIAIFIFLSLGPLSYTQLSIISREYRHVFKSIFDIRDMFHQTISILAQISLYTIPFILLTLTYTKLVKSNTTKFSLNKISLLHVMSNKNMALFVFIFYTSILLLSFILLESIINTLQLLGGASYINGNISNGFILFIVFKNILSFVFLLFLGWFYRNITLAFYLANNKAISWNYFFSMLPIINIILWIVNLSIFERSATYNRNNIAELLKSKSMTLVIIIIFITLLKCFIPLLDSRVDMWTVFAQIIDFALVVFYLNNKYGLYVVLGLETLLILLLVLLEINGFDIPRNAISAAVFFSIVRLILIYPVFHGNAFTVGLPKATSEPL
ncbi:hypothetical protein [Putridiphycobacter roseus]|nr:hypothetical protein [Putridiphycobacter roseus]